MRVAASLLAPCLLLLGACQAAPGAPPPGDDGRGPAGLDAPTPGLRAIGEVQGSAARSPFVDQLVTVRGTVVGNFAQGLGGVFIQSEREDGDPATAEGLYLQRDPQAEPKLRTGDRVEASGRVVELGDGAATLTALRENVVTVVGHGQGLRPTPIRDGIPADWERYEGMLVDVNDLVVTGNGNVARYGEVETAFRLRLWQPTELAPPGPEAQRIAADNERRRLLLDDARASKDPRNLWFLPHGLSAKEHLRAGTPLVGATGVLDQRRGRYRLQLTQPLIAIYRAERPSPPPVARLPGNLLVASFNLHNLFNGDGRGEGFPTERGAQTPAEHQRQLAKLVATVQALHPDIASLNEVENDGSAADSALAQFVAALNAAGPARDYRFIDTGPKLGNDAIRVAIIYREGKLAPKGRFATLTDGPFATRSRSPLAQAFAFGAHTFVVVANHFKSKGCGKPPDEGKGADADQQDGQGCFNAVRMDTARRTDAWLKSDPLHLGPGVPTLLLGDLNAYMQEDPLRWLRGAGWHDAIPVGHPDAYSFVFDGMAGRLDHALMNDAARPYFRRAYEWHVNADEADYFDYHNEASTGPQRSSDHDPLVLSFLFGTGTARR
jgi:predicted extracellular nuclease